MNNRNINDLREHLFDTLEKLKTGEIDIERAKAVSQVGQVIVASAKVEVDYIRANNGGETPFLESMGNRNLPSGVVGITRHKLVG